jgi:hypothetical protein
MNPLAVEHHELAERHLGGAVEAQIEMPKSALTLA